MIKLITPRRLGKSNFARMIPSLQENNLIFREKRQILSF